jgi:myo-inositol-1(or 4)-monophosphatase
MEIKELLRVMSEIKGAIKGYIEGNEDYGAIIKGRERDVTRQIDMVAEKALEECLKARGLCARIISEELGDHVFPQEGKPEFTLIFDPVDGSTNATLGIPFFCSSIAYSSKTSGVTFDDIQASVVATIYGKTFYATKGGNAYVNGKKLPCGVAGKHKSVFTIYTYGTDTMPLPAGALKILKGDIIVRVLGSIAIELCLVAEGAIDAVIDVRNLIRGYDIAGAYLILEEAKGSITDISGNRLNSEVGETTRLSFVAVLDSEIGKIIFA